jgi:hypothetical protein
MAGDEQQQQPAEEQQQQPTSSKKKKKKGPSFKEPTIKWKDSKARTLLYKQLTDGNIPKDAKDSNGCFTVPLLDDIYKMHEEYKLYDRTKFSSRLSSLRTQYHECMIRNAMDIEAFDNYRQNHQPSLISHYGYPEWQGSEAQRLLKIDLEAKKQDTMSRMDLWDSKPEFYEHFPLKVFRDKLNQEVRTSKYLHTLRERGKLHVES